LDDTFRIDVISLSDDKVTSVRFNDVVSRRLESDKEESINKFDFNPSVIELDQY
jgi:hypothetical protein